MPACGYEFYLLVFDSISQYQVEHSKIKFISTRGHVISSIFKVIPLKLFYYQTFFETWHS